MAAREREHYREVLPFFHSPPAWVLLRQGQGGLQIVKEGIYARFMRAFLFEHSYDYSVEHNAQWVDVSTCRDAPGVLVLDVCPGSSLADSQKVFMHCELF